MDAIGSLQKINNVIAHHADSKNPSLTKEAHTRLSSIGLLKRDGGACDECVNARSSHKNQEVMD